ncbi:hypothetical protein D0T84_04750 [Dysgonomonas sp. 521]|uniref:lipocalin family protein n=1 Tax=Dysgonomonas sp. 521 TaxID=2302932 RepID=UPI0013D1363F|nr:lipocalin family protein [Dysgonomonas sp. 521]NDV94228.1 hypothetical protein [Dysgonomonas sp. 521]
MKKIILLWSLWSLCLSVFSQDTPLAIEKITGRWVEVKETDNTETYTEPEYPYTYIFRENNVFHLGEASDGVILFNITGKYTLLEDTINVIYFDLLHSKTGDRKARQISFKVLSLNNNIMRLLVNDYDYSYPLILKKQLSTDRDGNKE